MNICFYILIFILGITFGSFLTLATYRIPLNQDITHERSYCPNCNHKLAFLDLIPVFSYIFLGGKCRYCKKKISPRYMIIEIITGLMFVIWALALNLNIYTLTISNVIEFSIGVLYIVLLFLIGAIDKEHKKIDKRVLIYGIIISIINVAFQYISCKNSLVNYNLNRIVIYLLLIVIVNIVNIINLKKDWEYYTNLIIFLVIISLFTYEISAILTVILTLLIIAINLLINKIMNKGKEYNKKMPIAYFLTVSNALVLLESIIIMFIR